MISSLISRCPFRSSDVILLFYTLSLIRLCLHPGDWTKCQAPVYTWLLVSHAALIFLRLPQHLRRAIPAGSPPTSPAGSPAAPSDSALLQRALDTASRWLLAFVWLIVLPFHCLWSVAGSIWLSSIFKQEPGCLPSGIEGTGFVVLWQALSYAWIAVYAGSLAIAWHLRKRLRQATADLHAVVDDDVQRRWGDLGLQGTTASPLLGLAGLATALSVGKGLSASEIGGLPLLRGSEIAPAEAECAECSICLSAVEPNDEARKLPRCNHTFHRACIDLWLLRQNACPLCKCNALCKEGQEALLP